MAEFKLTQRRAKALKLIEYFIPSNVKWTQEVVEQPGFFRISRSTVQSAEGVSPEEAFFMKSESGKEAASTTDLARLEALLWGQRWLATHEKMWREGAAEGTLLLTDFTEDPESDPELQDMLVIMVKKIINTTPLNRHGCEVLVARLSRVV